MAHIPVVLEFSTATMSKTLGPGANPIHGYTAPTGYVIINWGFSSSGGVTGDVAFGTASVTGDGTSFGAEVINNGSSTVNLDYAFTLLKV